MCAGLWFLLMAPSRLPFGYVFVYTALFLAFDSVKKLLTTKPGFFIGADGIKGYSGSFYFGPVSWPDITNVRIVKILWQKTIVIYVNEPLRYINKKKNPLITFPMRMNYFFIGSPFCITTDALNIKVDDLLKEIEANRKIIARVNEGNDGEE
jgi:hypothetical protein